MIADDYKPNEADHFAELLTRALDKDCYAIAELINYHSNCNDDLANDKHIVVQETWDGKTRVGLLGIINGYLNKIGSDKLIAGIFDQKTGTVIGFTVIDSKGCQYNANR